MVNFGLLAAEIVSLVWGTPANFNGFRILAALLHGTLVVGVNQTMYVYAVYCYRPSSLVSQSLRQSACHTTEPCKNGLTSRDAVCTQGTMSCMGVHISHGKMQF